MTNKDMFKPFSDNLIFLDTEFTGLDINKDELISLGMVKMNGEELYLEFDYKAKPIPWVKKHVLPNLDNKKILKTKAIKEIKKFVGDKKPYAISYVNQFDIAFFYKLIPHKNSPFHFAPIDIASMLFAVGMDPEMLRQKNLGKICKKLKINKGEFKTHNALDDAKIYRKIYFKLIEAKI